jgi:hypothetical protein
MAVFMKYLLNLGEYKGNRIISSESAQKMRAPAGYNMNFNKNTDMGLGLINSEVYGLNLTGHDGSVAYFNTDIHVSFDHGLGFFAAANSTSSRGVPQNLAPLSLIAAIDEKTGQTHSPTPPVVSMPGTWEIDKFKQYAGLYPGLGPVEAVNDSQVYLPYIDMYFDFQSDYSFFNPQGGKIAFDTIDGTDVIVMPDLGGLPVAEKVAVSPADPDVFKDIVGTYTPVADPGETPIITAVTLSVSPDGYGLFSFNTNDGQYAPNLFVEHLGGNMFYIPGTARNLGKVFTTDYGYGVRFVEVFGEVFKRAE